MHAVSVNTVPNGFVRIGKTDKIKSGMFRAFFIKDNFPYPIPYLEWQVKWNAK